MKTVKITMMTFIALFLCGAGNASHNRLIHAIQQGECKSKWEYFVANKALEGEVVFHVNANELCGIQSTASVTLVRTAENDTIRVLEFCNISKKFSKGELIVIHPEAISQYVVGFIPSDPRACSLKQTCYGIIESKYK